MKLYRISWLRAIVLPLLKRFNPGDVTVRHHYTGDPVRLHAFHHKGYWYHGANRERDAMNTFRQITPRGGTVIEVGGHIGYIALYFAKLVGPEGQLHVFEPGPNNLPYIRRNVGDHDNITLCEMGVGAEPGELTLYVDDLTGQNNSFIQDFEILAINKQNAHVTASAQGVTTPVVTLDGYTGERDLVPDLIKIDVEGFEFPVLQGARETLREHKPMLMVEFQREQQAIFDYLDELGYLIYDPETWRRIDRPEQLANRIQNTFCFNPEVHEAAMKRLGLRR